MEMQTLDLDAYSALDVHSLQFEQQPGWLGLLHRHCHPDKALRFYINSREPKRTTLPLLLSQKRLAGLDTHLLEGTTGLYSSHYLPEAGDSDKLRELLQQILQQERWDVLRFSAVDEGGDLHQALTSLAGSENWPLRCSPDFEHWYLKLEEPDFDAYSATLPGVLRSTLRRKQAKLEDQGEIRFDLYAKPQEVSAGLDAYTDIYARSWKNAEAYPEFIPELSHWAAHSGWLRLGIFCVNNQAVAAQIWLVLNGRASIFKLAYDQAYQEWSVGTLLTARMIQFVLEEDGVTEIEYGKGGEAYKRDWMSSSRQRVQLACYNPATLMGRVMALRHYYLPGWRDRLFNKANSTNQASRRN